jgi:hypothetical protein
MTTPEATCHAIKEAVDVTHTVRFLNMSSNSEGDTEDYMTYSAILDLHLEYALEHYSLNDQQTILKTLQQVLENVSSPCTWRLSKANSTRCHRLGRSLSFVALYKARRHPNRRSPNS